MDWKINQGDAIKFAKEYDGPKFHALLTDPPYFLDTIKKRFGKDDSAEAQYGKDGAFNRLSSGFLGQGWDTDIAFDPNTWKAFGNILYPGALGMSYIHSRTYHRLALAIEAAGFIIYPMIVWVNSQGFPHPTKIDEYEGYYYNRNALKGAIEPLCVFQKPYEGTMKENILEYGTGLWNIEGARIQGEPVPINKLEEWSGFGEKKRPKYKATTNDKGRWPANFIGALDYSLPFDKFFYQAKPSRSEKDAGLNKVKNDHPTIKPIDLNRHLANLLLPPEDFVPRKIFNPFSGTGSEMIGAALAGWDYVEGIELKDDTVNMAIKRLEYHVK